jgi:hypothetical protein
MARLSTSLDLRPCSTGSPAIIRIYVKKLRPNWLIADGSDGRFLDHTISFSNPIVWLIFLLNGLNDHIVVDINSNADAMLTEDSATEA